MWRKVWRKWNDLKHAYRNIYLPNFIKGSGQNDDDALVICIKHYWAYKKMQMQLKDLI
jgi:hypothetical protein